MMSVAGLDLWRSLIAHQTLMSFPIIIFYMCLRNSFTLSRDAKSISEMSLAVWLPWCLSPLGLVPGRIVLIAGSCRKRTDFTTPSGSSAVAIFSCWFCFLLHAVAILLVWYDLARTWISWSLWPAALGAMAVYDLFLAFVMVFVQEHWNEPAGGFGYGARRRALIPIPVRKAPEIDLVAVITSRTFVLGDEDEEPVEPAMCIICLETPCMGDSVRELHCGHVYHSSCLETWVKRSGKGCPLQCTIPVSPSSTATTAWPETFGHATTEEVDSDETEIVEDVIV